MLVSGIILAGGKSSRMGQDKARLKFQQETLITRSLRVLQGVVDELIIVGRAENRYHLAGTKEVSDIYQGAGPLAGIHAGLQAAAWETAFVAACDMPFINEKLIRLLLENSPGYDVVAPRKGGYPEPLCAVYKKACLPLIENNIEKGCLRIVDFYPLVKVNYIDEDKLISITEPERAFRNINTKEEYRKLCRGDSSSRTGKT